VVTSGELGDWIATYHYDGVGRLITIDRLRAGEPVTIDLYYDGVRRIQEVLTVLDGGLGSQMMAGGGSDAPSGGDGGTDMLSVGMLMPGPEDYGTPAAGGEFTPLGGEPPPPSLPEEQFDPAAEDAAIRLTATSTATSEPPVPEGGDAPQQMSGSGSAPIAEREYVWGPGYVDECVAQFDQNNVVYYVIQDANYDVVALLKSTGLPSIQYTYEAYAPLQLAESFAQQPVNRLGH
jgi:hypothetical protein